MKRTITAENQFTDPMLIKGSTGFSISITGIVDGMLTVQRVRSTETPDVSGAWADVKQYTAACEENGIDFGTHWYRIGCKTGDFVASPCNVEINRG